MRFLSLATTALMLSAGFASSSSVLEESNAHLMSVSRLFGANAVTAQNPAVYNATSSPDWTTGYGFTSSNIVTQNQLPYPPHTLETIIPPTNTTPAQVWPAPVGERFSTAQVFGPRGTLIFATLPLSASAKRNKFSGPYNNTVFTSRAQFPKVGAGALTSIDIFDDEFFGITHLNGPNPTLIRKIAGVSPKFGPVATLRSKYPQLDGWIADGQVYELDYAKVAGVVGKPLLAPDNPQIIAYPQFPVPASQQRYMAAPYVLLAHVVEQGVSKIVPIAIQLGQTYTNTTAVVYRVDYKDANGVSLPGVAQGDWQYAKTIVNSADATLHQLDAHLVKTHLVMENVIIGTHVKLPETHVISRLIVGAGHSLKTLQINEDARLSLLPGIVDEVFAGGYVGAGILVNTLFATYNWLADYIPADLTARGFHAIVNPSPCASEQIDILTNDGSINYLYAQDAMDSWNVIYDYVYDVLKKAYPNDRAVANDANVQAWAQYLASPQAGLTTPPVPGFPSSFTTRSDLANAVTASIYKATVGHSVVNYPQPFYNAYTPVYPTLALYRPPLTAQQLGTGLTTEAYIAAALGNANTQQVMTGTANALGQPIATSGMPEDLTLLQYVTAASQVVPPTDDKVGKALQKQASQLLSDLTALQIKIQSRDASFAAQGLNHYQYSYFDPSRVANAIYA